MAKKNKIKDAFLTELRKIPIVQVACEKVGISRNSVYRWRNEDANFLQEMETALAEGEALVNDMSESQLLSLIQDKNWQAISFWLRSHHPKYGNKIVIQGKIAHEQRELTPEEREIVDRALRLALPSNMNEEPFSSEEGSSSQHNG